MNFQMFILDLEKAEEPEIELNICWIIEKARESQKKIYFCFIDMLKPLTVWITKKKLWKNLKEMEKPNDLTCLLRNLYANLYTEQ